MENGAKRIQYQKVKMVPYLDESGIFLLACPACECEWAHILTTPTSKRVLVYMSPWHSITGRHTCVSCTSPPPPGLHSTVYWLWPLQPPAPDPIHDPVSSGAGAVGCIENASHIFHCLRGVPRRAPHALRWGVLSDFISMPPSPKNHKDQKAWILGRW